MIGSRFLPITRGAFVSIAMLVAAADLWSKFALKSWLAGRGAIEVTPFFNLRLGFNDGISFGLFPAQTDMAYIALVSFAFLASAAMTVIGLQSGYAAQRVALALIIGGAVGNAVDRLRDGFVTDFLDLHAFGWHWPTFNIADTAIAGGAALLIAATLVHYRASKEIRS